MLLLGALFDKSPQCRLTVFSVWLVSSRRATQASRVFRRSGEQRHPRGGSWHFSWRTLGNCKYLYNTFRLPTRLRESTTSNKTLRLSMQVQAAPHTRNRTDRMETTCQVFVRELVSLLVLLRLITLNVNRVPLTVPRSGEKALRTLHKAGFA